MVFDIILYGVVAGVTWFILDALVVTLLSKYSSKLEGGSFLHNYARRKGIINP